MHVGRQSFKGHISELCLWPVQVILERIDQPCLYRGAAWKGALVFLSGLKSMGGMSVSGRRIHGSDLAIFPWDVTDFAYLRPPTNVYAILVQEDALADYARIVLGMDVPREALRRSVSVEDGELAVAFQREVKHVLFELASDPGLLEREAYRTAVLSRVMNLLVQVLAESLNSSRRLSPPSTRSYVVAKTAQYMDSRLADQIDIADVCRAIRVSQRTLRYSFDEVVGLSPTEYLLAMRLARVRRDLLQAGRVGQIHCVAERYGFSHLGRFSRFYFDAFGERPSDTCRRTTGHNPFVTRSSVERGGSERDRMEWLNSRGRRTGCASV